MWVDKSFQLLDTDFGTLELRTMPELAIVFRGTDGSVVANGTITVRRPSDQAMLRYAADYAIDDSCTRWPADPAARPSAGRRCLSSARSPKPTRCRAA